MTEPVTTEERAVEALAEATYSPEMWAAFDANDDSCRVVARHNAALMWSRIDRDAIRAALLADVRQEVEELTTHEFIDSYEPGTMWLAVDRADVLRLLGD